MSLVLRPSLQTISNRQAEIVINTIDQRQSMARATIHQLLNERISLGQPLIAAESTEYSVCSRHRKTIGKVLHNQPR